MQARVEYWKVAPDGHVPDDVYELARRHFNKRELVDLTMAVVAINAWNRLAISFRQVPGSYRPATRPQRAETGAALR